jgi:uncharacterized membrane protein
MFIESLNETVLPVIIAMAEFMGIFVVTWSLIKAFYEYLADMFFHKNYDLRSDLANGLAMSLEFKMGAEILKTVMVTQLTELVVLGAVIVLRALLSLLIHFELKGEKKPAAPAK